MKSEEILDSIRAYLENTLHYSRAETKRVMKSVKQMDDVTFRWLGVWCSEGTYPDERVEDITVEELVNRSEMEPVNAFIAFSWLKQAPEEAKYALTHPWNALEITEEVRRALLGGEDGDE